MDGNPGRGARERRDGDEPGPAPEDRGDRERPRGPDDRGGRVDLRVPGRREVHGEERAADAPRAEACEPQVAPGPGEEEPEPDRGERAADPGEVGAHRRLTISAARTRWAPTLTVSVYRPGLAGARSTSSARLGRAGRLRQPPVDAGVGEDAHAEARAGRRLDPAARQRDVPDDDDERLPRRGDVPRPVLGREL